MTREPQFIADPSHTRQVSGAARVYSLKVSIITGLSVGLFMWSADNFRPFRLRLLPMGFALFFAGAVMLLIALRLGQVTTRWPAWFNPYVQVSKKPIQIVIPGFSRSLWTTLLGVVSLLVLTLANLNPPLFALTYPLQFALFGIGIVSIIYGLGATREVAATRFNKAVIWELLLVCLITLLAFGLQFYQLETAVHTLIDEGHTLLAVLELGNRSNILILSPYTGGASSPWLFPFLQTGALAIFGHTLLGLRFVSILFGSFTIPALYVLAKYLFDRPTAFIAALLLATFPPFMHLSRLAMVNAADPWIGTLLLAFLARGLKSNRRIDFVIAGVFLALTQYFYDGGKMLFPALVAVWLLILMLTARLQASWKGVLLMLLAALLLAAPIFVTWWSWNLPLFPRLAEIGDSAIDWGAILSLRDGGAALQNYLNNNLLPPVLHLIQRVDTSYFYYGGETPLILGFMLPTFFLGLIHALWRWRVAGCLLLCWVAMTVLGNSLLIEAANSWSVRYMVVLPVLALLMALGLRFTAPLLVSGLLRLAESRIMLFNPSRSRWMAAGSLGVLVIVLAALQVNYYFNVHLPFYNQQIRMFSHDHIDAYYRLRLLPPDTSLYLVTDDPVPTEQYDALNKFWNLHPLVTLRTPALFTSAYVSSLPSTGIAFFIDPDNADTPALLRARFADIQGPQYSPYNVPLDRQYALYYLPPRTS